MRWIIRKAPAAPFQRVGLAEPQCISRLAESGRREDAGIVGAQAAHGAGFSSSRSVKSDVVWRVFPSKRRSDRSRPGQEMLGWKHRFCEAAMNVAQLPP